MHPRNPPAVKEGAEGEEEEDDDDDEVKKIEGCDIHWKAGKNVTVKLVKKKGKGKNKKPVTKEEEVPSFFRFFETPDLSELDDEETDPEAVRARTGWRGARAAAAAAAPPA